MKIKHSSGFTLITVLIFLVLFSLMSLYSLTRAKLTMKENNHHWQIQNLKLKAKNILLHLEKSNLIQLKNCFIPIIPTPILSEKSIAWWKKNSCSGYKKNILYYFSIESLEIDECGVIKNSQKETQIPHYYRITLLVLSDKLGAAMRYFMQSIVALPENKVTACQDKIHFVNQGRQMRREI